MVVLPWPMIDDIHILPIRDLIEHEESWKCVCGPEAEYFEETGRWMYSHHSLDGRELNEAHDA
jgi:hypothetical protein